MSLYVETDYWIAGYAEGDDETVVTALPVGGGRRRRYHITDNPIRLTENELEAILKRMLREEKPTRQQAKKYIEQAKPSEKMLVQAVPAYIPVRNILAEHQERAAIAKLKEIAEQMMIEEDERDIEALLLH